ncbi:MAG: helix-turn-helix transcriptional regulator [Gemmatirosa sp.]
MTSPLRPHADPPPRRAASVDQTAEQTAADGPGLDDAAASAPPLAPLLVGVLALVVIGGVTDLVLDRPTTLWSLHVAFELTIILVSLSFAVVLWRGWWRAARDLQRTRATLAATRRSLAERQAERDAWRRNAESALADFGQAVDAQFRAWQLTPTEREVAFLLLQGHGHKQIAAHSGRSERTVRQHAVSVYQKSGLGGRAELAAFFLQDLVPPAPDSH